MRNVTLCCYLCEASDLKLLSLMSLLAWPVCAEALSVITQLLCHCMRVGGVCRAATCHAKALAACITSFPRLSPVLAGQELPTGPSIILQHPVCSRWWRLRSE